MNGWEITAAAATIVALFWAVIIWAVPVGKAHVLARRQRRQPAVADVHEIAPDGVGQSYGLFRSPPLVETGLSGVPRGRWPVGVDLIALRRFRAAITVRTAGPATVILHNARIVVLERSAPSMPYTVNFAGGGGGGAGDMIHLVADLDLAEPIIYLGRALDDLPFPESTGQSVVTADRRPFTQEWPLRLNLYAIARNEFVKFRLALDLEVEGQIRELLVDNDGKPFAVSGEPDVPEDHRFVWYGGLWDHRGPRHG